MIAMYMYMQFFSETIEANNLTAVFRSQFFFVVSLYFLIIGKNKLHGVNKPLSPR